MNLVVNDKLYNIKFAYIATVKSGIIKKLTAMQGESQEDAVERTMELIPELLLVGLQKNHRDEFGYNYDTKDGYDVAIEKAYNLIDDYLENENGDFLALANDLQGELVENSFLAKMFQAEKKQK